MKESYKTVKGEYSETTVIEKSKFITRIKRVASEEEARAFIAAINKEHYDATHNCYAFIADKEGLTARFSDDGEPQGTAGLPMLEALKNSGLSEVVAVVTRYFGGIKLGAGGLVRAYSGCVASCVKNAPTVEISRAAYYGVNLGYEYYKTFLKLFSASTEAKMISQDFSDGVRVEFAVKTEVEERFIKNANETFLGKLQFEKLKEDYGEFL